MNYGNLKTPKARFEFLAKKLRKPKDFAYGGYQRDYGLPVWAVKDGKLYEAYVKSVRHITIFETSDNDYDDRTYDSYIATIGFMNGIKNPFIDEFGQYEGFRGVENWYQPILDSDILGKKIFLEHADAVTHAPADYRKYLEFGIQEAEEDVLRYEKAIEASKANTAKMKSILAELNRKEPKQ